MAVPMETGSSSAASCYPPTKHHVFLSFRGEDTRDNFTCHLYEALCRKKIATYIDDRLDRGEEISSSLVKAIEESKISVIVFSEHYASSAWCLDELTKILECKEKYAMVVIPIFYNIDPSIVRHQRGSYADAFVKHEQRFKHNLGRVQSWRHVLTQAASLFGCDSKNFRPDSKLVDEIVEVVLKKLNRMSSISYEVKGLVGIDKHIMKIESALVRLESKKKVSKVGIWGISGIGKTTIAKALFDKLSTKFEFDSCSFVENVGKEIEASGIYHVRSKYLSEILKEEHQKIIRSTFVKERLEITKVLLVLDDVRNSSQMTDLIEEHDWFHEKSIIFFTSTDKQVLENAGVDIIHKVEEMNFHDALQLFSVNAFKQNHPIEDYAELSEKLVNQVKGIPLALKVMGTFLHGRRKQEWESALQQLEKAPNKEIYDALMISYDRLDQEHKDIFLDIACFFKGQDKISVEETLKSGDFSVHIGMSVLEDRCFIYNSNGKILMHDLIEKMGHQIVQQSAKVPGKRSRLWKHQEISYVLRKNKGTEEIQCIFLNMCNGMRMIELHGDPFGKMENLRMLQFYNSNPNEHSKVYISGDLESLPEKLRFLRWDGFPQRCLPSNFCPENLVTLDLRKSHLEFLWDGDQLLPNLKRIDLSGSNQLIKLPDFSHVPNIEEIILSYCTRLRALCSSIALNKLHTLWLDACFSLHTVKLCSNLLAESSGLVVLYNCKNLNIFELSDSISYDYMSDDCSLVCRRQVATFTGFSDAFGIESVESVDSDHEPRNNLHLIKLKMLRDGPTLSSQRFNELCWLDLSYCDSLVHLPNNIFKLGGLRRLYLFGCSNLRSLPEIFTPLENLTVIILDETSIRGLPKSMEHFIVLEELSLCKCRMLESIPSSIGNLNKLCKLDLTFCDSLETLPSSIFNLKIARLDLSGCLSLEKLPDILDINADLKYLCLQGTAIQELPSSLQRLIGLQNLRLEMCRDLEFVPNNISNMTHLTRLNFSNCSSLSKIPENIGYMSLIRELSLHGCKNIVTLPASFTHLSSLKSLDLRDCENLQSIPELPPILQQLLAFDCPKVERVSRSKFTLLRDSQENVFEFHLTNCEQLHHKAYSSIVADSRQRFGHEAYSSVVYCFPGSRIPNWFPYCSQEQPLKIKGYLDWCTDILGFAVCVVVTATKSKTLDKCRFGYRLAFKEWSYVWGGFGDQQTYYCNWKGKGRYLEQDHIFLWNCNLENYKGFRGKNFAFEIYKTADADVTFKMKECGLCPLYKFEDVDSLSSRIMI